MSGLAPLLSLRGWHGRQRPQAQSKSQGSYSYAYQGSLRSATAPSAGTGGVLVGEEAAGDELGAEFTTMLSRLAEWKDRYYECIVPRKVGRAVGNVPSLGCLFRGVCYVACLCFTAPGLHQRSVT